MKCNKTTVMLSLLGGVLACGLLLSTASAIRADRRFSKKFKKR